jgi:hypothetical protein
MLFGQCADSPLGAEECPRVALLNILRSNFGKTNFSFLDKAELVGANKMASEQHHQSTDVRIEAFACYAENTNAKRRQHVRCRCSMNMTLSYEG